MKSRKGFTLVELMVVIFIVGILAAVAIPIMRGRIDSAKWSEGKSAEGSIRTGARAFCAERGPSYAGYAATTLADLGFTITAGAGGGDLDGKYFSDECYSIAFTGYDDYLVTVDATASTTGEEPASPSSVTLDELGAWTEVP